VAEQDFILLPDGLHIWGNPSRLSGVPEDIVGQESTGYSFYPMQNPEWRKLSTDTMEVMGDVPDEALKTLAVTAEKLEEMLQREIGMQTSNRRSRMNSFTLTCTAFTE
jgi:hypothetical protein